MLQRLGALAAAAVRPGLGFWGGPGIQATAAASAACGSLSSARWQRGFSADAGDDKPAAAGEASAPEPAAAEAGDPPAEPPADGDAAEAAADASLEPAAVHEALIDVDGSVVPEESFTKRQRLWLGLGDPAKTRHFLPKLSRAELGSFTDENVEEEFELEQELYPTLPDDKPFYDLRESVPEIYRPTNHLFERVKRLKESQYPDMPLAQFVKEVMGIDAPEEVPPRPGARRIIRWQVRHVFAVGVSEGHPDNKRVKAWVHLRDLQREHGLTDAALQHIALVCGPRYNPNTGVLKLTSDRYPHREANRAHIRKILDDLVAEGHRKHPASEQQAQRQQEQQQQAGQQQEAAA